LRLERALIGRKINTEKAKLCDCLQFCFFRILFKAVGNVLRPKKSNKMETSEIHQHSGQTEGLPAQSVNPKKETRKIVRLFRKIFYLTQKEKELNEQIQNGLEFGRKAAMINVPKNVRTR
jgi:hypothetical protein